MTNPIPFLVLSSILFASPVLAQKTGHATSKSPQNHSKSDSLRDPSNVKGYFLPDGTWVPAGKRPPADSKFRNAKPISPSTAPKSWVPAGAKLRNPYSFGSAPIAQPPTEPKPNSKASVSAKPVLKGSSPSPSSKKSPSRNASEKPLYPGPQKPAQR